MSRELADGKRSVEGMEDLGQSEQVEAAMQEVMGGEYPANMRVLRSRHAGPVHEFPLERSANPSRKFSHTESSSSPASEVTRRDLIAARPADNASSRSGSSSDVGDGQVAAAAKRVAGGLKKKAAPGRKQLDFGSRVKLPSTKNVQLQVSHFYFCWPSLLKHDQIDCPSAVGAWANRMAGVHKRQGVAIGWVSRHPCGGAACISVRPSQQALLRL